MHGEMETGWPFFDACMRYLTATGWINFDACYAAISRILYTLWLPWQATGSHLANLFMDYEPGIHWSQVQMQSGVTGINSVRAYSVGKQSTDHDSEGDFIRQWVPELAAVPTEHIHEPWLMSKTEQEQYNCRIDIDYPAPIVDEKWREKRELVNHTRQRATLELGVGQRLFSISMVVAVVKLIGGKPKISHIDSLNHVPRLGYILFCP